MLDIIKDSGEEKFIYMQLESEHSNVFGKDNKSLGKNEADIKKKINNQIGESGQDNIRGYYCKQLLAVYANTMWRKMKNLAEKRFKEIKSLEEYRGLTENVGNALTRVQNFEKDFQAMKDQKQPQRIFAIEKEYKELSAIVEQLKIADDVKKVRSEAINSDSTANTREKINKSKYPEKTFLLNNLMEDFSGAQQKITSLFHNDLASIEAYYKTIGFSSQEVASLSNAAKVFFHSFVRSGANE